MLSADIVDIVESIPLATHIGQLIKKYRLERTWSQEDLAVAAKISQSKLARTELGKSEMLDLEAMEQIAQALEIPTALLLTVPRPNVSPELEQLTTWLAGKNLQDWEIRRIQRLIEAHLFVPVPASYRVDVNTEIKSLEDDIDIMATNNENENGKNRKKSRAELREMVQKFREENQLTEEELNEALETSKSQKTSDKIQK